MKQKNIPKSYPECLKQIGVADDLEPSHDVRDVVLRRFKELGGDPDRWNGRDRSIMADAITKVEDDLELRRVSDKRDASRLRLRDLRRTLE